MTAPPTLTTPAAHLEQSIRARIEQITTRELDEHAITEDLDTCRRQIAQLENTYILSGLEGTNEKTRQAHMQELLKADVDHRNLLAEERAATHQLATIRIALAADKRQLALEMELLRHMRPAAD